MERRCSILVIQLPFDSPLALLGAHTPRVYHVCADVREWIVGSTRYRGLKGFPARMLARGIDQLQAQLLRSPTAIMVANGEAIFRRYGSRGRTVISSALSESEVLSVKRQRPAGPPFRVLFVGYLRHEKGIDVLIRAFRHVRERVPAAELEIVGAPHTVDQGIKTEMERQLADLLRTGQARVLPPQPFGPKLFQHFADADVLALPSRSEGTPRVLVEARAFGCPVVATRVGGIPSSVVNDVDGLLVSPDDAAGLAAALIRVWEDRELRERLIAGGIERAKAASVERFSRDLGDEVVALRARCDARRKEG
jgi:glycosyltransferase involved in cell wall biosynthesis